MPHITIKLGLTTNHGHRTQESHITPSLPVIFDFAYWLNANIININIMKRTHDLQKIFL